MELKYTAHALYRCKQRGIPVLLTLPESAPLADRKNGADTFKIGKGRDGYFIVVVTQGENRGTVLTVMYPPRETRIRGRQRKRERKQEHG